MELNSCCIPMESLYDATVGDNRWKSQHLHHVSEARDKEPEVVFIGDGVIQYLSQRPVWTEMFEPLHSLNFGILKDGPQHVLWRIQNGILDHINPKAFVIHVGGEIEDRAIYVAEGILNIVEEIHKVHPNSLIIVMGLLPRGRYPNRLRDRNDEVNKMLESKLSSKKYAEYIGSDCNIIQADGTINHYDMFDYAIPTDSCYRRIFTPIYDLLLEICTSEESDEAA